MSHKADCFVCVFLSFFSFSVSLALSFRDNNFIKDFPQLADGLMVIPLPVEEQCRGVLSEPLSNVQLLTGVCTCVSLPHPSLYTHTSVYRKYPVRNLYFIIKYPSFFSDVPSKKCRTTLPYFTGFNGFSNYG